MAKRHSISKETQALAAKAVERRLDTWHISVSEPFSDLFCPRTVRDTGGAKMKPENVREDIGVIAAFVSCGLSFACIDTERPDIMLVRTDIPVGVLSLPECFMKDVVAVLRMNNIHGTYHKFNEKKRYEF